MICVKCYQHNGTSQAVSLLCTTSTSHIYHQGQKEARELSAEERLEPI